MGFLNDLLTGLIRPKKYGELLNRGASRVVVYALILILISSTLLVTSLFKMFYTTEKYYNEVVPDFSFENNTLTMAEPFKLEFMGMIIKADSQKELTKDDFGDNIQGVLFDSNSMLMRSAAATVEASYKELTEGEKISFSKKDSYLLAPTVKVILYVTSLISVLFNVGGFFLGVLVVALFGLIPNKTAKLSFGKLYILSIFSRGLPIILSLILSRFIAPIPTFISILISFIILNIALSSITNNGETINNNTPQHF